MRKGNALANAFHVSHFVGLQVYGFRGLGLEIYGGKILHDGFFFRADDGVVGRGGDEVDHFKLRNENFT